jgi:hypothetical protein
LAGGPWVCFARVSRFVCVCFFEFEQISPGCLGDPHGYPRQPPPPTEPRA